MSPRVPVATRAAGLLLEPILGTGWRQKALRRSIPVRALESEALRGLARALRALARASAPGERFALTSWAGHLDHAANAKGTR